MWKNNKLIDLQLLTRFFDNLKVYMNDTISSKIDKTISVTYNELKTLKNLGNLTPGNSYRITDYDCTTIVPGTSSAHHKFDIILEAISESELSQQAKVCKHNFTTIGEDEVFLNTPLPPFTMQKDTWAKIQNMQSIPESIKKLLTNINENEYDVRYGQFSNKPFKKGTAIARFDYISGSNKINCVGVELFKDNELISADYHVGFTGNSSSNNTYVLQVPEDGNYRIRYYIEGNSEEINSTSTVSVDCYKEYFDGVDFSSWEVKYCLDYDPTRFGWSDISSNYRGIIYYMKDEHGNECPYDFKNILFDNYYTFSYIIDGNIYDGTVKYKNCYSNIINSAHNIDGTLILNKNMFLNTSTKSICAFNEFGGDCTNNSFGDNCSSNKFGNYCKNNEFISNCMYNTFDDFCENNTFYNYCQSNSFGVYCRNNSFGSYIIRVSFGKHCSNNKFTNSQTGQDKLLEACRMIEFGDQCSNINLYNTKNPSYSSGNWLQNIKVNSSLSGEIEITNLNSNYSLTVARNSKGDLKIYCEADMIY